MSWNLPRTKYDQRCTFYEDIESLILPGFLSHSVRIGRTVFTFRTMFPSDFFMLEQRTAFVKTDREWRVWFVSSCVWMINGINLLEETHSVHLIRKAVQNLPAKILNVLFYIIVGLINRTTQALEGAEAYFYEGMSRLLWRHCNKNLPNSSQVGGVPGISLFGLNTIQKMWIAYNITEDERMTDQVHWNNAKFIASSHAPRGVDKVNSKDETRNRGEEERRLDICDFYFYKRLGMMKDEDQDHRSEMRGVRYAQTVDELEDEMRRWVSGEHDEHDRIVEEYKNSIRERMREEQIAREKAWEEARLQAKDEGEYMPPIPIPLTGFTQEEVMDMVALRQTTGKPGARFVAQADSPKRHQLFDKYLNVNESSGLLQVQEGEIMEKKDITLDQQVTNRDVIIKAGDE